MSRPAPGPGPRAILLAAGRGTRLGPLTDARPKCLVDLWGRSLLDRALDSLGAGGIREVALVTGWRAEDLAGRGLPTRHNPDYERTNMLHSLFCASDLMGEDVVVVYGDIAFHPRLVRALLAEAAPFAVVVDVEWRRLWALRMEDPLADAETLRLDAELRILELGRRPRSYGEVQGQYIGLFRLRGEALEAARGLHRRLPEERTRTMFMTDFIQAAIDEGQRVQAVPVHGGWVEVDRPEDLSAYEHAGPGLLR
ncbi:MAG: phosphocholine cytidylyltransferase family protein [Planctomycetes bacterium]|nr:phosphocholine cytidylyltransferase family protein [Planctomycetota bacterium]